MRHEAIRLVYKNAATINGDSDVFDEKGNRIVIDESLVANEESKLQEEYDAQLYARNRQAEYPSLLELTVALYDTDDKSAVEAKRASVKLKYPKPS
tara:strand:- start:105 stop:392 length:288 start_codon:yes stop_codon:yes gene_type:complete